MRINGSNANKDQICLIKTIFHNKFMSDKIVYVKSIN